MKLISFDQIAVMNLHYYQFSLEYFLDRMADLGIKNVELIGGHQGLWIDPVSYQDPHVVREKLEKRDISVPVFTPQNCRFGYQFAVKEPALIERTYRFFSNGIRLGVGLGAKLIEVNSGWGYWNEEEGEALARSAAMLRRLSDVAAEYNVTLVAEALRPQESRIGFSLKQMKKLFDMISHPNFKMMLDLTAMSVAGESIQEWFDVFGSDIIHAHFQDCDPYGHYIWGNGKRNLRKDLEAMIKNGYKGYYTQELTAPEYYLNPFSYDMQNIRNLKLYAGD